MANLAQTVNVLQSVILTDGDRMVLTPTYHVFDLFKAHQDAEAVDCFVETAKVGTDEWTVDRITASASKKDGRMTLTLANLSMDEAEEITVFCPNTGSVNGRILTGDARQYNDFGNEQVTIQAFDEFLVKDQAITLTVPGCSVVELTIA